MGKLKREINWESSVIRGGNYDPFVYRDENGIHVGDRDNHEIFPALTQAIQYAQQAVLSGDHLLQAQQHAADAARDNLAAEYHWHEDALLQLDALITLGE